MNSGTKILNKVLFNQIKQHMEKIIHHEIQEWFNIHNSVNVIHHVNRIQGQKLHNHLIRCKKRHLTTFLHDKSSEESRETGDMHRHNEGTIQQAHSQHRAKQRKTTNQIRQIFPHAPPLFNTVLDVLQ